MSFRRYKDLKPIMNSIVGSAPKHWQEIRLRFVAQINPSKSEIAHFDSSELVSFLPMEAIGENGTIDLEQTRPISEVERGFTYFRDGDVGFAKITPCFENGKGAIFSGLTGGVGFGTTELVIARPKTALTSSQFLHWLFTSQEFRSAGEAAMYGAGGQKRVPESFVKDFHVALPPLSEQQGIVTFLDRETAKIDALVEEQRRLIELLKEKRQAVISHAVTNGLNPDVPMKDSGIEWLGKVPAHWEVKPLMWLTDAARPIMYGIVLPGPDVSGGIPIVKGGDVKPGRLKVELLNRTTPEIEAPYARARLRPKDIVYSIRGTIGDAEFVPEELSNANITQDVARVSPSNRMDASWLLYALRSRPVFIQLEQRSLGAAVRGINIYDLKRARVPVPPIEEQKQIAEFLERETSKSDFLVAEARKATVLLQERRSALISAAVTGRIDVRGLVQDASEAA